MKGIAMKLAKLHYQIRNWRAHWRGLYLGAYITIEGAFARWIGGSERITMSGVLAATVIRADGTILNLGCISRRVVTTAGVNYLRDDFNAAAGGADISLFKYHGCGTGTVAEAVGDTALVAECTTALNPASTRAVGSQAGTTSRTYTTVGMLTFGSAAAVTEHGLFSAAVGGTLWDRSVFAAYNVAAGDSIYFTYTLTIADGG